jgi:hypothetical protein
VKTLFLAPVTFEDILRCYLIAQIAQDPLLSFLSSPRFFSILFPFLLENTLDILAPVYDYGPFEIDPTRAFIFLPRLGGIHEMPSRQSCIHENLLSQRPFSSGIPVTSTSKDLGRPDGSAAPGGLPAL